MPLRRDTPPRLGPLLAGTALLAIAMAAGTARGQAAFQGNFTATLGNVSLSSAGTTDTITVGSPTAIVDWRPTDTGGGTAPIVFLPGGTTGVFQGNSAFTVLNRINPATTGRPIEFDGRVVSQIIDDSGAATRGGTVWFQAPGGIIVGATGVFDVGSLILTTNAIDTAGDTALPDPATGLRFAGTAGSLSAVTIRPGATIRQPLAGSYLAIVAPRIAQGGNADVNGSVGYIAAEAATVTINAGLFDISNATGSTVAAGGETTLSHTGTTTGNAATSAAAPHVAYLVAVPQNDAVTLLASGSIGYRAASTAGVVNGTVVLGAGSTSQIDPSTLTDGTYAFRTLGSAQPAAIDLRDATLTSQTLATSSGPLTVSAQAGDVALTDLFAYSQSSLALSVAAGRSLAASGTIHLHSRSTARPTPVTIAIASGGALRAGSLQAVNRQAGGSSVSLDVAGGVDLGSLLLDASYDGSTDPSGNATAGTSRATVDGGRLTVAGAIEIRADALPFTSGATASGGTAALDAIDGGTIATGTAIVSAVARGGTARGGTVSLDAMGGGTLTASGDVQLVASGTNGAGAGAAAGGGAGGITAGGGTITIAGATTLDGRGIATDASAAAAPAGYDAAGGSLAIVTRSDASGRSGTATFGGPVTLDAGATAYQGSAIATGSAAGGFVGINAQGGGNLAVRSGLLLTAGASANASAIDPATTSTGGTASVQAQGGTVTLTGTSAIGGIDILANADGGTATGGTASLSAAAGAIGAVSDVLLQATGSGGAPAGGAGYGGIGGTGEVRSTGGAITLTSLSVDPTGRGGSGSGGASGGDGRGGVAALTTSAPAATITIADYANLAPFGRGGNGGAGNANGTGGTTTIAAQSGTIAFTGDGSNPNADSRFEGYTLYAIADGIGGAATAAGRDVATGGIGTGGRVDLVADYGGTVSIASSGYLSPYGTGGSGDFDSGAGRAVGGMVTLSALNSNGSPGTVRFGTMTIDNGAFGGRFGGDGGSAIAGSSTIAVRDGGTIAGTALDASTYATGGDGSGVNSDGTVTAAAFAGGAATGGSMRLTIDGGTVDIGSGTGGSALLLADATGGRGFGGGDGGAASAATATLDMSAGALRGASWTIAAATLGGIGGNGIAGIGGTGGGAVGGTATVRLTGGAVSSGAFAVTSAATGGGGGVGASFSESPTSATSQDGFAGGLGGDGSGGAAGLFTSGAATLVATDLAVVATATGGQGGQGGDGAGIANGVPARGGDSGTGGRGTGGAATLAALGGTITASDATSVTALASAGSGALGGQGGTAADGTRTRGMSGAFGDARGGVATIETDQGGQASLGATSVAAGGVTGATIESGTIDLLALDSAGTAPATPMTFASLTAVNAGNLTTSDDRIQITAAAPIAVSGDATLSGFTLAEFGMSGRGTLNVGGALAVDALEVIGTQSGAAAGVTAITAGSATIGASFAGLTLAGLATSAGDLALNGATFVSTGSLSSAGALSVTSGGSAAFGAANAIGDVDLTIAGALSGVSLVTTQGSIDGTIRGSSSLGSVAAGETVSIRTFGAARYGSVAAGTDAASPDNDGGSDFGLVALRVDGDLTIDGGVSALGSIGLLAGGALSAPTVAAGAGGSAVALAGGTITLGDVVAPRFFYLGGPDAVVGLSDDPTASEVLGLLARNGNVPSGGAVTIASLQAGTAFVTAEGTLDAHGLAIAGRLTASGTAVTLVSPTASLAIAQATASGGDLTVTVAGDLTGTTLVSTPGSVTATAAGRIDLATVSAGDTAALTAGGALHAGLLSVGGNTASVANDGGGVFGSAILRAGDAIAIDRPFAVSGSIILASQTAGIDLPSLAAGPNGTVAVLAGGAITLGPVTAPGLVYIGGPAALGTLGGGAGVPQIVAQLRNAGAIASGDAVTIGAVTAGGATIAAGTRLTLTDALVATAGGAAMFAGGDLAAQDITATGAVSARSGGGALAVGRIAAGDPAIGGGIQLAATTQLSAGPLAAAGSIAASSSAGGLSLTDVASSGGAVALTAGGGDVAIGAVRAAGSITIAGTGAITAGDLTAGTGPLLPGEGGAGSGTGGIDAATGGIASGFDGTLVPRCDDCATGTIELPFTINYFGRSYGATYVSNNGYLTFNSGQGSYTPSGLGTGYSGQPIIAAFFADVDTNNSISAQTAYGIGTFAGRQAFGATWNGVGYFPSQADKLNNFQIVLTNRADTGAGNFDIYYNYTNIQWETGSASGGSNGFGGVSAGVGYNAGTGNQPGTFFQLAGSLVPGSFLNSGTAPLIAGTNDGVAGQLLFSVRNGQVIAGAPAEPPTIHVTNVVAGNSADIRLGSLSGEAAEVHGAGRVTVGNVAIGTRDSGVTGSGQRYATVLDATGGLIAGDITSTGLIALGSTAGDVSAGTIAGGASVMVLADGSVSLGAMTTGTGAGDSLYLGGAATDALPGFAFATLLSGQGFDPATLASVAPAAAGGSITVAGPIATGTLRAAADGAIGLGGVEAAGGILIAGGAGITSADLRAGGDLVVAGTGDVALASIAAGGAVAAKSTGGTLTAGTIDAGTSVDLAAAGLLTVAGIDGTAITLSSADIAVASGAGLGSDRTAALAFVDIGSAGTSVGDTGGAAPGGYALSAGELAGAHAAAIAIRSGGDAAIGDLTLRGSNGIAQGANLIGDTGRFSLTAPGAIRVVGAATFTNLAAGDGVAIDAGGDLTGVLPAGSLTLDDGARGLAGTLALSGRSVRFATAATLATISATSDAAAIDTALGDPGGLNNAAGYLRAETVSVRFGSALYTQNSGASSALGDRAGVTAQTILLTPTVTDPAAALPALVLNARLGTMTGGDVFTTLRLSAPNYASGSTLNGCLLSATACAAPPPPVVVTPTRPAPAGPGGAVTTLVQTIQPVQDVVDQVIRVTGIGNAATFSFDTPALISVIGLSQPAVTPLIDEPVTGAGNDDLWVGIGVGREVAPMGGTTVPRR